MKKITVKSLISSLQHVAQRFPFVLMFIISLSCCLFLDVNKHDLDIPSRVWVFFALGTGLSMVIALLTEELENVFLKTGINLLFVVLLLIHAFTLPDKLLQYHYYQQIILGGAFILSAFVISFLRRGNDIPFWEFSKTAVLQLIIASVFAQVLMLGLSLAVLSLKELFSIDIKETVYANIAISCFALFGPVYFMANIPAGAGKRKQTFTFPTFLKILGLYIFLPLLALYSLILYVYLVRIIASWELPNGWVSTLVSILGLGGFLTMFVLYPLQVENQNRTARLFARYFPLFLIPLLVLMSVGIFRRLADYGVTINRCYVLLLNLWLYGICIYLFISHSKHLKWIVVSFVLVAFTSSMGPWSVFSVTKRVLFAETKQLMANAGLVKDGHVVDNSKKNIAVDSMAASSIIEKISYVTSTFGVKTWQPLFTFNLGKKTETDLDAYLGLTNESPEVHYFYAEIKATANTEDIEEYRWFGELNYSMGAKKIFESENWKIVLDETTIQTFKEKSDTPFVEIPLKDKIKYLIGRNRKSNQFAKPEMTLSGPDYKLILKNISGSENDSITITAVSFQLFLK
ncbi:MAG TPA: DUF4153 domain-containing protein [Paludibacter sp.]|nr:DUF4153 domain-containing protein [Paludibacter sp.]